MFRRLESKSGPEPASGVDSFRRQRIVFAALNASLLGVLLFLHFLFSSFWGVPPVPLVALLAAGMLLRAAELLWFLLRGRAVSRLGADLLTWASIAANLFLAGALAAILDREDSQYFALLIVPVLESSFRFSLRTVLGVVAAAGAVTFYWVWRYDLAHPPVEIGEYFEAGTISMIFAIVAVLVCLLVRQLRRDQSNLARTVGELRNTRERLLTEEKLAAVGRLASAVAHEVRNPVAMIMSSLATAKLRAGPEREEMLDIAAKEASRLVNLTTDFLNYARPRVPKPFSHSVPDVVRYVADVCQAHAISKGVQVRVEQSDGIEAEFDAGMLQQALINLVMNALDACSTNAVVKLAVSSGSRDEVRIDVENPGGPIPPPVLAQMFEPFFTTKPAGTGLGLATARGIARAHGGDLVLADNGPAGVRFSLTFPARASSWAASSS